MVSKNRKTTSIYRPKLHLYIIIIIEFWQKKNYLFGLYLKIDDYIFKSRKEKAKSFCDYFPRGTTILFAKQVNNLTNMIWIYFKYSLHLDFWLILYDSKEWKNLSRFSVLRIVNSWAFLLPIVHVIYLINYKPALLA